MDLIKDINIQGHIVRKTRVICALVVALSAFAAAVAASTQEVYVVLADMDSNKAQGGIQLLLAAEQEAQHIIGSARAAKSARLKQAKEEAEREIAAYRAQRENEFRKKVAESSGDSGSNVKRLEEETQIKIEQLKSEASKVSPEVVAMLMKYVTTVKN